jgi:hypothetical protein
MTPAAKQHTDSYTQSSGLCPEGNRCHELAQAHLQHVLDITVQENAEVVCVQQQQHWRTTGARNAETGLQHINEQHKVL